MDVNEMKAMKTAKRTMPKLNQGPVEFPTDGMATVLEACRFLRLTRPTVDKMIRGGRLESAKFGRAKRISWKSIRKLAEEGY